MKRNDVIRVSKDAHRELQGYNVIIKNRIWNGTTYDYIVWLGFETYFLKGDHVVLIK